jgi:heme/copper-type cytochrome/quinol oxidase subunit 2
MPGSRVLIVVGVAVAAVVLFLVLRPGDDEPDAPPDAAAPPAAAPAETEPADEPDAPAEPEPEAAEPETISIVVREGLPEGGVQRMTVDRGTDVRIIVRADVVDHVHLHGYDIMRDVAPGSPAQIRFTASIPGRFEVELEDRRRQIAEIDVLP